MLASLSLSLSLSLYFFFSRSFPVFFLVVVLSCQPDQSVPESKHSRKIGDLNVRPRFSPKFAKGGRAESGAKRRRSKVENVEANDDSSLAASLSSLSFPSNGQI